MYSKVGWTPYIIIEWIPHVLTNDEIVKINNKRDVEVVDWQLQLTETQDTIDFADDKLLEEKKTECRWKILNNYSRTDQRNANWFWTQEEKDKMRNFIKSMTVEFRTNWKDSDFTNINPI